MLDKFESRGLTVFAINLEPTQRQSVLPLLKATGITFVPLESNWAWAQKEYGVDGTPAAMLLDEQGRIIFRPSVHDAETRTILERQIDALLVRSR